MTWLVISFHNALIVTVIWYYGSQRNRMDHSFTDLWIQTDICCRGHYRFSISIVHSEVNGWPAKIFIFIVQCSASQTENDAPQGAMKLTVQL
jgi:hypothetical protein